MLQERTASPDGSDGRGFLGQQSNQFLEFQSARPVFIDKIFRGRPDLRDGGGAKSYDFVVYTDVDVIFVKRGVLQAIREASSAAVRLVSDNYPPTAFSEKYFCSCLVALEQTPDARKFLQDWAAQIEKGRATHAGLVGSVVGEKPDAKNRPIPTDDQVAMNEVIRLDDENSEWQRRIGRIRVENFPPGKVYGAPHMPKVVPVIDLSKETKQKPMGFWLHANWRLGHELKRDLLARFGGDFSLAEGLEE